VNTPVQSGSWNSSHVVIALAGIAFGCIAALVTIPEDISPPGALRLPTILFACGMLSGLLYRLIKSGFQGVLYPEWAVTIAILFFILLDMIQGLYPLDGISREAVRDVYIGISLFCAVMFLATAQKPWRLPQSITRAAAIRYSPAFLERALWLCFFLGIFYFAFMSGFSLPVMLTGLTRGRFAAPWSRGSMGGWLAFIEHMVYFGYLLPPLTVVAALVEGKWLTKRVLLGLTLCLLFLPFLLQGGGRRIFAMCLGSAVFTWLCAERKNVRARHLIILAVVTGMALVFMDVMLANRNKGAVAFSYSLDEFHSIRVDDNFLRFSQMLDLIPKQFPYMRFQWVEWVLARPIPRALWPGKPVNPGFDLAAVVGVTASLSCSSIAEWYGAFGWFGIAFGGYLYGRLSRFWGQLLEMPLPVTSIGIYSIGLMALVISVRSMIELLLMSYPLIAVALLSRFVGNSATRPLAEGRYASSLPGTSYR
jgi:oligosaccharide repeat unit polymerase